MEVYVIGAGAAGLMAAVSAADAGAAVTLLETMEKPGKKISITGNGRCNLTNRDIQDANFYFSDAPKTADGILKAFQAKDTLHFFENAGLAFEKYGSSKEQDLQMQMLEELDSELRAGGWAD